MFVREPAHTNHSMSKTPWSMLPVDHPHSERPLRDHNADRENTRSSPRKPVPIYEDVERRPGMHKKTKSSVSLKSLIGNDKARTPKRPTPDSETGVQLKRPKSSTGLSALLSRSRSPKKPTSDGKSPVKDKENRTPPQTADITPPPIWAQFATQQLQEPRNSTTVPLNDNIDIEREAALYTPQEYSPSKQRNFHDDRPTLARKTDPKPRPRSEVIDSREANAYAAETSSRDWGRFEGRETAPSIQADSPAKAKTEKNCGNDNSRGMEPAKTSGHAGNASTGPSNDDSSAALAKQKRGSRVMAAVAALNGTSHESCNNSTADVAVQILDVKVIENEFETLLVSRLVKSSSNSS